jgi:hypothetical protein
MKTILAFISIFDLFEFKKQANIINGEVKVNLLIGKFSPLQIDLAIKNYKAKIIDEIRANELLN